MNTTLVLFSIRSSVGAIKLIITAKPLVTLCIDC